MEKERSVPKRNRRKDRKNVSKNRVDTVEDLIVIIRKDLRFLKIRFVGEVEEGKVCVQ